MFTITNHHPKWCLDNAHADWQYHFPSSAMSEAAICLMASEQSKNLKKFSYISIEKLHNNATKIPGAMTPQSPKSIGPALLHI